MDTTIGDGESNGYSKGGPSVLRKLVLVIVIAVLFVLPVAAQQAQAWDACDMALYAPAELRGPLTVLCWTLLIEFPDPFEAPDPGGTSGGAEW